MSEKLQKVVWPGWETGKIIGRGSFGTVFEIHRQVFDETEKAAVKVISIPPNKDEIDEMRSNYYDDESITNNFKSHMESLVAEYTLTKKMNGCSNIVHCDDIRCVQHDDGIGWDVFIKMELLTPLDVSLPKEIPEETVIKLAKDICHALELCEKNNILHRDIKPANIFVSGFGDYKLGDFGIAKVVEGMNGGTQIGSPPYMAPEIYHYHPYGINSDIYSLGIVLYEKLNERHSPFLPLSYKLPTAEEKRIAIDRRMNGEPIPPPKNGSHELKNIVLKACAYDPAIRYSSATEMLADLNALEKAQTPEQPEVINPIPNNSPAPPAPPAPPVSSSVKLIKTYSQSPYLGINIFVDNQLMFADVRDAEFCFDLPQGQHQIALTVAQNNGLIAISDNAANFPPDKTVLFICSGNTQVAYNLQQINVASQVPTPKSKGVALALAIFPYTGWFGIHDFYLGNTKKALLKVFTCNLCFVGWVIDIVKISSGNYTDKHGRFLK